MSKTTADRRALTGTGAALFRAGLARLVDELELAEPAGIPLTVGLRAFDHLGHGSKLAELERAARGLLVADVRPDRTAVADAAVAAVYEHVSAQLAMEVDEGRATTLRRLVRAACADADVPVPLPRGRRGGDVTAWADALAALRARVLPDRHWAQEWPCPDADPDAARAARRALGVDDDDYFVAVEADPDDAQLERVRTGLRKLSAGRGRRAMAARGS